MKLATSLAIAAITVASVYAEKELRDENEGVNQRSDGSDKCDGIVCLQVDMPVCGSDGVWYSDGCELGIAAYKNPSANIVEDASTCSSEEA